MTENQRNSDDLEYHALVGETLCRACGEWLTTSEMSEPHDC